ncbi:hypothetical protein HET73_07295 [Wolbachia endosymbiont of Atemnus politus]|nr:hypothetical protein [Wolbachia endosymbiont of Atemnus politus]
MTSFLLSSQYPSSCHSSTGIQEKKAARDTGRRAVPPIPVLGSRKNIGHAFELF